MQYLLEGGAYLKHSAYETKYSISFSLHHLFRLLRDSAISSDRETALWFTFPVDDQIANIPNGCVYFAYKELVKYKFVFKEGLPGFKF